MKYLLLGLLGLLIVTRLAAEEPALRDQLQQLVGDGYRVTARQGSYSVESVQSYKGYFVGINGFRTEEAMTDPEWSVWEDHTMLIQVEDVVLHRNEEVGDIARTNRHVEAQLERMRSRLERIPHRDDLSHVAFYKYQPRNDEEQAEIDIARSLVRSLRPVPDMLLGGWYLHVVPPDYIFRDQAVKDRQNALLAKLRNFQMPKPPPP